MASIEKECSSRKSSGLSLGEDPDSRKSSGVSLDLKRSDSESYINWDEEEEVASNMILIAIIGIEDPVRPEVSEISMRT